MPEDCSRASPNVVEFDVATRRLQKKVDSRAWDHSEVGTAKDPDSFPRDITLGPDGSTLYVPNFCLNKLEVIKTFVCHPERR